MIKNTVFEERSWDLLPSTALLEFISFLTNHLYTSLNSIIYLFCNFTKYVCTYIIYAESFEYTILQSLEIIRRNDYHLPRYYKRVFISTSVHSTLYTIRLQIPCGNSNVFHKTYIMWLLQTIMSKKMKNSHQNTDGRSRFVVLSVIVLKFAFKYLKLLNFSQFKSSNNLKYSIGFKEVPDSPLYLVIFCSLQYVAEELNFSLYRVILQILR